MCVCVFYGTVVLKSVKEYLREEIVQIWPPNMWFHTKRRKWNHILGAQIWIFFLPRVLRYTLEHECASNTEVMVSRKFAFHGFNHCNRPCTGLGKIKKWSLISYLVEFTTKPVGSWYFYRYEYRRMRLGSHSPGISSVSFNTGHGTWVDLEPS